MQTGNRSLLEMLSGLAEPHLIYTIYTEMARARIGPAT